MHFCVEVLVWSTDGLALPLEPVDDLMDVGELLLLHSLLEPGDAFDWDVLFLEDPVEVFLVAGGEPDNGADGVAPGNMGRVSVSAAGELSESSYEVAEEQALLSLCGCVLEVRPARDAVGLVFVFVRGSVVVVGTRP